jgi:hypothetical protein
MYQISKNQRSPPWLVNSGSIPDRGLGNTQIVKIIMETKMSLNSRKSTNTKSAIVDRLMIREFLSQVNDYSYDDKTSPDNNCDRCDRHHYPTIQELFSDVWGNKNPQPQDTKTICTRESSNPANKWNGGDYDFFLHYNDLWLWSSDSSDFDGSVDASAGYVFGIPIILVGLNGEYNPYDLVWSNGTRTTISPNEAFKLQEIMQIVVQTTELIHWFSHQEWNRIIQSYQQQDLGNEI